jgi:hypothetical protein
MSEHPREITLTDDESAAIQHALQSYLRDLRGEIADTDNPAYKRELRDERTMLESAIAKLSGPDDDLATDAIDQPSAAAVLSVRVVGLRWRT